MEVTLDAVSPFGVKHSGGEKWVNFDKKSGLTKDGYNKGDVVSLTVNDAGFVTSMKVVTAAPPKKAFVPGGRPNNPERNAQMSRGAAIKAVLASPLVAAITKDMSNEEALAESFKISAVVAKYIEEGV